MKISKEILKELAWEGMCNNFKVIKTELVDNTRWSLVYDEIIQDIDTGKYYLTSYSTGATECQDESPYEYDPDEIEVVEVVPTEKTIIEYVKKEEK